MSKLAAWFRRPRPKHYWIATFLFWGMIAGFIIAGCIVLIKGDVKTGASLILFPLFAYALQRLREQMGG